MLHKYDSDRQNQTGNVLPRQPNLIVQFLQMKRWFDYRSKIEKLIHSSARKGRNRIKI